MGIQARVSALMAICLIVCGHTADAFPSLWASLSADMANTQDTCPQPHIAYGQHGDPQPDPSITFAVTQGGTAVQAYCPGMVLLVTVSETSKLPHAVECSFPTTTHNVTGSFV